MEPRGSYEVGEGLHCLLVSIVSLVSS